MRLILLSLLFAVCSYGQDQAVAFDAVQTCAGANPTCSNMTVGTGLFRALVCIVSTDATSNPSNPPTYAGVSMTLFTSVQHSGNKVRLIVYRLSNPDSGSNALAITTGAGVNIAMGCTSYSGVDQATPIAAGSSATGTSTAPSATVFIANSNQMPIDGMAASNTPVATVGSGQTQRFQLANTSNKALAAGSTKTGTGTITMAWTLDASQDWIEYPIAVKNYIAVSWTKAIWMPGVWLPLFREQWPWWWRK